MNKEDLEKYRGKLIVFEGPDNSGKTTVAKELTKTLNEKGIPAIFTFQPGDNDGEFNQVLHDMAKTKKYTIDPLSNLFVFLLDRSIHTASKVIPALKEGITVVCDRWWYSTIAYQFHGKQLLDKYHLDKDFAYRVNEIASHRLVPDVVYYFEREQEKIDNTENDVNDAFENESDAFKRRVKKAYLDMLNQHGEFVAIQVSDDANKTLERVVEYDFNM